MIPPRHDAKDLTLEPVREPGGNWRLAWTWWEQVPAGVSDEGWDKIIEPSEDALLYPSREAALSALARHRAAGALPKMESPDYGPA